MGYINQIRAEGFMEAAVAARPEAGQIALFWLGQAGYFIKTAGGHTMAIDPCLSDYCESKCSIKRLIPTVCTPEALSCDTLIISHEHEDHFDGDLITKMAELGHFKRLLGPATIRPLAEKYGVAHLFMELAYDTPLALPDVQLVPVYSDHDPGTMGFVFYFEGLRLYYAGDTAYSPEKLSAAFAAKPDLAILPINGEFGNLDAAQAYTLAKALGVKAMNPCHFWMYAIHGSCPLALLKLEKAGDGPKVLWLALGEGWIGGREEL